MVLLSSCTCSVPALVRNTCGGEEGGRGRRREKGVRWAHVWWGVFPRRRSHTRPGGRRGPRPGGREKAPAHAAPNARAAARARGRGAEKRGEVAPGPYPLFPPSTHLGDVEVGGDEGDAASGDADGDCACERRGKKGERKGHAAWPGQRGRRCTRATRAECRGSSLSLLCAEARKTIAASFLRRWRSARARLTVGRERQGLPGRRNDDGRHSGPEVGGEGRRMCAKSSRQSKKLPLPSPLPPHPVRTSRASPSGLPAARSSSA
jgi:hypothetical protein